jgi:LPS sulfotransferase NodH
MKKFIIIAPARSGSRMLVERLGSHPCIHVQQEILNPKLTHKLHVSKIIYLRILKFFDQKGSNFNIRFNGYNFDKLVDNLVWGRSYGNCGAAGFKIIIDQWLQLSKNQQEDFFNKHYFKVILLRRKDTISHLVSTRQGELNGYKHRLNGQPPLDLPAVDLTLEDIKSFHRRIFLGASAIKSHFSKFPLIETTYEDLVNDPDRENKRLLEFLGVRDVPLLEVMARNSNHDLSRRIAGFEEFAQSLRGTAYEHLLPDGYTAKA